MFLFESSKKATTSNFKSKASTSSFSQGFKFILIYRIVFPFVILAMVKVILFDGQASSVSSQSFLSNKFAKKNHICFLEYRSRRYRNGFLHSDLTYCSRPFQEISSAFSHLSYFETRNLQKNTISCFHLSRVSSRQAHLQKKDFHLPISK